MVEMTIRRLKTWKHLGQVIDNKCIPTIMNDWRFVAAINNCFFVPYLPYNDDPTVAYRLLDRMVRENNLQSFVTEKGLTRKKSTWVDINNIIDIDVPYLNYPSDFMHFGGNYQLELAKSYYADH